jgi:hypothetical protein
VVTVVELWSCFSGLTPFSESNPVFGVDPVFGHPFSELNVLFKNGPLSVVDSVFRVDPVFGVTHNFKISPDLSDVLDSLTRVSVPVSNTEAMHGVGNKRHQCQMNDSHRMGAHFDSSNRTE